MSKRPKTQRLPETALQILETKNLSAEHPSKCPKKEIRRAQIKLHGGKDFDRGPKLFEGFRGREKQKSRRDHQSRRYGLILRRSRQSRIIMEMEGGRRGYPLKEISTNTTFIENH